MNSMKSFVLNPVMTAPWNTHHRKNYDNPSQLVSELKKLDKKTVQICQTPWRKTKRVANTEILMQRFNGLKKYQARAALTMAGNDLEKAIVLLEVSLSYQKEVVPHKHFGIHRLRNINIKLQYDNQSYNPAIRNVVLENSCFTRETNAIILNGQSSSGNETFDETSSLDSSNSRRVGVFIEKTDDGYKATPFDESALLVVDK